MMFSHPESLQCWNAQYRGNRYFEFENITGYMNRRAFSSLLLSSLTLGAGCSSLGNDTQRIYKPQEVGSIEYSTDSASESNTTPEVEFIADDDQIRITGTAESGNPCHELVLDSLTHHTTENILYSLVVPAKLGSRCPDSLGSETYELELTFASELPQTVRAEHRNIFGETFSTEATK